MRIQNQNFQKQFRLRKLQIRNRQLFIEFNSEAQMLMINATNSLIMKESDV